MCGLEKAAAEACLSSGEPQMKLVRPEKSRHPIRGTGQQTSCCAFAAVMDAVGVGKTSPQAIALVASVFLAMSACAAFLLRKPSLTAKAAGSAILMMTAALLFVTNRGGQRR